MKQSRPVAVSDLAEVDQHGDKGRSTAVLRACHCPEQGTEAPFDAIAIEVVGIGQNVGSMLHLGRVDELFYD